MFLCDVDWRKKRVLFRRVSQQMKTPAAREQLEHGLDCTRMVFQSRHNGMKPQEKSKWKAQKRRTNASTTLECLRTSAPVLVKENGMRR